MEGVKAPPGLINNVALTSSAHTQIARCTALARALFPLAPPLFAPCFLHYPQMA